MLATTGKNKGKSNAMTKYDEIVPEVVNNIIPSTRRSWIRRAKFHQRRRRLRFLLSQRSRITTPGTQRKPVLENCQSKCPLRGPTTLGRPLFFSVPMENNTQISAPQQTTMPRRQAGLLLFLLFITKKRALTKSAASGAAMNRALVDHNNIMVAKFMMKYGNDEDKKLAVESLRHMWNKGKENTPKNTPETSTPSETSA